MSGSIEHSPEDIIRNLIIDLGHGTAPSADGSWPVFTAQEPNTPDSVITVYGAAGLLEGKLQPNGEVQEHYGIQIRIRDVRHYGGYAKANDIAVGLDPVLNRVVEVGTDAGTGGSTNYIVYAVSRRSGPLAIGTEPESKRRIFTINVVCAIRQAA